MVCRQYSGPVRRVRPVPNFVVLFSPAFSFRPLSVAFHKERVKGIEPSSSAWKAVALPLSYTRMLRSPTTIHRRSTCSLAATSTSTPTKSQQRNSTNINTFNGEAVGGAGFEPAKAMPSDLQSDPFDRSGNPPGLISSAARCYGIAT